MRSRLQISSTGRYAAALPRWRSLPPFSAGEFPMRVIQGVQVMIQNRIIMPVLASKQRPAPPLAVKLLNWIPALRRLPARIVGLGVRPEHIQTPDLSKAS